MVARISTIRILVISFTFILLAIIVLATLNLRNNKIVLAFSINSNPDYVERINEKFNYSKLEVRKDPESSTVPHKDATDWQHELQTRLDQASEKKIILVWYKSGMSGPGGPAGREKCGNCLITKDRTLINDTATAAVVFYYYEISPKTMPPDSTRHSDQMYVFWNKEPTPLMRYVHRKELDFEESVRFNATMTYRRDSDFYNTYRYHWIRAAFNSKLTPEAIVKLKTNVSIALVSDCSNTAGAKVRLQLLEKIKSLGFSLDTFGKCFPGSKRTSKNEKETINLIRKYKFYFAFENSYRCKDYITEKLYRNSLFAGAVPVVFGSEKSDYEAAAPPGSFIFLEDFDTLQDLVTYLQYLDHNDTAYLEYHKWRTTNIDYASPGHERVNPFCQLCRSLYGINVDDMYNPRYSERQSPPFTEYVYPRHVSSLKRFMFEEETAVCMERNETLLPPSVKYNLF